MKFRVAEEFFDVNNDPDCLNNLIDEPKRAECLADLRERMEPFMAESGDPMLKVFHHRDDAAVRKAYFDKKQAEADERRKLRRDGKKKQVKETGPEKRSAWTTIGHSTKRS